ncbi:LON peptidase substrate-binding domain-containing protein [Prauserella cavernicola]|uniref:LON peptidase substrate-binding domain-containing protein n=1 Tax=Prauserella cavernicola TaxID=2800127 RepID=A0A934V6I2_9PSEU|nr:LON peptidase substrate-binding domain-containing protein [Prauserella cavernicola]MBK1786235.1 LON peptidase substrate-binding domain-containing protein [Prauserella cavernicola]
MPDSRPEGVTTLPLFPLQTVLLPGAHLPLHIFEPRYRQLTVDLVNETLPDRLFGVVAIKTALVREVEELDHVQPVGCAAVLRQAKQLPDGRFDLVTTGDRRFRLLDIDARAAPYLVGTVEWVDDHPLPDGSADAAARLGDLARASHHRYCASAWERDGWNIPDPETRAEELAYLLAADCLLPVADRQALLEERNPLRRLRTVCQLLAREAGFLSELRAVPAPFTEVDTESKPSLN